MPAHAKPRRITITQPFDYYWPQARAVTAFPAGSHKVKAEVADFAVAKGYASEHGATADTGPADSVGDQDPAEADRSADGQTVDDDPGERE